MIIKFTCIQKTIAAKETTKNEEGEKKIADLTSLVEKQEEETKSSKAEMERLQTVITEMEDDKSKKEKDIAEMQE